MSLAPGVFMRSDVLTFGEIGRTRFSVVLRSLMATKTRWDVPV